MKKVEICAMKLLVVAATMQEIALFDPNPADIDILITGVGIPAATYHVQKKLYQSDYDFVIQAGFAGSYRNQISLGETVLVAKDCFGDLGLEEKEIFTPLFDTGLGIKDEFPFANGWLANDHPFLALEHYTKVNAITVNTVSDSKLLLQQRMACFNPDTESMEGAAFHYICLQEKIPFLQVRTISNYAGERDKTKWTIKEAVVNLNRELNKIINFLIA